MKHLIKISIALSLLLSSAYAYSDRDFDGISDALDQCPNSSMDDIVNAQGCTDKAEWSFAFGESYSNGTYGGTDDITTLNTNLSVGVKFKEWYIASAFSYFSSGPSDPTVTSISGSSGLGDTYVTAGYVQTLGDKSQWSLGVLGSVKLPTADTTIGTGQSDLSASFSASYAMDKLSILSSFGYTLTGDSSTITYNDVKNLSLGLGNMMSEALYMSLSYSYVDAYINGSVATQSLSLFASYNIDKLWNASLTYGKGLSDAAAANALSVMLTRKF